MVIRVGMTTERSVTTLQKSGHTLCGWAQVLRLINREKRRDLAS